MEKNSLAQIMTQKYLLDDLSTDNAEDWAWEFVRRHPDYRALYDAYMNLDEPARLFNLDSPLFWETTLLEKNAVVVAELKRRSKLETNAGVVAHLKRRSKFYSGLKSCKIKNFDIAWFFTDVIDDNTHKNDDAHDTDSALHQMQQIEINDEMTVSEYIKLWQKKGEAGVGFSPKYGHALKQFGLEYFFDYKKSLHELKLEHNIKVNFFVPFVLADIDREGMLTTDFQTDITVDLRWSADALSKKLKCLLLRLQDERKAKVTGFTVIKPLKQKTDILIDSLRISDAVLAGYSLAEITTYRYEHPGGERTIPDKSDIRKEVKNLHTKSLRFAKSGESLERLLLLSKY